MHVCARGNSAYVLPCTRWHCVMHITPLGCKICTQSGHCWRDGQNVSRRTVGLALRGVTEMIPTLIRGCEAILETCDGHSLHLRPHMLVAGVHLLHYGGGLSCTQPRLWVFRERKGPRVHMKCTHAKTRGGNGRRSARVCVFKQTGRLRLHQSQHSTLGSRRGSSQLKRPVMRPI